MTDNPSNRKLIAFCVATGAVLAALFIAAVAPTVLSSMAAVCTAITGCLTSFIGGNAWEHHCQTRGNNQDNQEDMPPTT